MDGVLAGVAGGVELKKAETVDKSAPVIEKDVHVGENPHSAAMAGIAAGVELKKAETVDKSAPVIEKDVHVGENKHGDLMAQIAAQKKD